MKTSNLYVRRRATRGITTSKLEVREKQIGMCQHPNYKQGKGKAWSVTIYKLEVREDSI